METEQLARLVTRAQAGDEDAYQALYSDAFRSSFYLALRMVKNVEDAEDIAQEVFITVHEKISELREPAAFYKWVNRITHNKCSMFLRKYRGIEKLDDVAEILAMVDDDPLNLPDRAIDDADTRKIILEVIDNLPDGQRACVILYYYQQLTITQIADELGINENTVKSRLALGRAKIRAALDEKEKTEGIKLYGIPLALTPILGQAMEEFQVPEGLAERVWGNISRTLSQPPVDSGAEPPGGDSSSGTPGQTTPGSEAAGSAAASAAGMTLVTKIIIGIVAAAVITAGAVVLPPLLSSPNEAPPPAVTDTQTPSSNTEESGGEEISENTQIWDSFTSEQQAMLEALETAAEAFDYETAFEIMSSDEFQELYTQLKVSQDVKYMDYETDGRRTLKLSIWEGENTYWWRRTVKDGVEIECEYWLYDGQPSFVVRHLSVTEWTPNGAFEIVYLSMLDNSVYRYEGIAADGLKHGTEVKTDLLTGEQWIFHFEQGLCDNYLVDENGNAYIPSENGENRQFVSPDSAMDARIVH